jgi:hypothetical protein
MLAQKCIFVNGIFQAHTGSKQPNIKSLIEKIWSLALRKLLPCWAEK